MLLLGEFNKMVVWDCTVGWLDGSSWEVWEIFVDKAVKEFAIEVVTGTSCAVDCSWVKFAEKSVAWNSRNNPTNSSKILLFSISTFPEEAQNWSIRLLQFPQE